jgi:3-oxoacyl-[acyl-carrier-protein] synthase-3
MPPHAEFRAIEYYLPQQALSTQDLASQYPEWSVEKIDAKTGIRCRYIAAPEECSSDLAVAAAQKLFATAACGPKDIDFILLCTQSPDYFLPPTACIVQDRLGIPTTAGAFDFNLGSSGFVYGLGLAEGLISSGQASSILLLTADTYSKFIHPRDRSVRTIFGDAAAATLLTAADTPQPSLGPFVYGTDGSGAQNLIVPAGGMRRRISESSKLEQEDDQGNVRTAENLFMAGAEIFYFTLLSVPAAIEKLLTKAGVMLEDVDLFVFHQANLYILDHLRKRMKIEPHKFYVHIQDCGNTVSCTIPIALKAALEDRTLKPGDLVLLAGFGVGYSWGITLLRVPA